MIKSRLENTVQMKLTDIKQLAVKPTKMLISERESSLKSVAKVRQSYDIASTKGARETKIEALREKLDDEEKRCEHISEYLETNLLKYEERRVSDCAALLNEYINAHMFFHCRAIEALTKASASLSDIDPREAVEALKATLDACHDCA